MIFIIIPKLTVTVNIGPTSLLSYVFDYTSCTNMQVGVRVLCEDVVFRYLVRRVLLGRNFYISVCF